MTDSSSARAPSWPEAAPASGGEAVHVERTRHGPFERLSFRRRVGGSVAQVSVYRLGALLIDTGGTRVTRALLAALAGDPPRRVLLTHQHEDHVGNLGALRRAFGDLPVLVPRPVMEALASPARVPPYRATFWGLPEPVRVDTLTAFEIGEVVEEGDYRLESVATPGHTPPHVAYLLRRADRTFALSGDLYTNRPLQAWLESAADDSIHSYRRLAREGACLTLLPTHGRTRADGARVLDEGADWLEREADRVTRAAASLGTADPTKLADALYGEDPMQTFTEGEIGAAVFVRSVLAPVRGLPAAPVVRGPVPAVAGT